MKSLRFSRPQINPVLVREGRTRMRGARPYVILTLFLVALVAAGFVVYQLTLQQARFGASVLSVQVGTALFSGLSLSTLLLVVLLAPAMTSSAISSERERLTYDMLLATPLRPIQLLWGKLIGALSYLFLLLFAVVPVFSVVLMFGGVEPQALIKVLALLLVATVTYGTIGLFFSSFLRRTGRATIGSYATIIIILGGTALLAALWSQFNAPRQDQVPPYVLYLNPFTALLSIITITPQADPRLSSMPGGFLGGVPFFSMIAPGATYYGVNGPVVVPIYRATLLIYTLLTSLLCWLSSHFVRAHRRWRLQRDDLWFALFIAGLSTLMWTTRVWWFVAAPTLP